MKLEVWNQGLASTTGVTGALGSLRGRGRCEGRDLRPQPRFHNVLQLAADPAYVASPAAVAAQSDQFRHQPNGLGWGCPSGLKSGDCVAGSSMTRRDCVAGSSTVTRAGGGCRLSSAGFLAWVGGGRGRTAYHHDAESLDPSKMSLRRISRRSESSCRPRKTAGWQLAGTQGCRRSGGEKMESGIGWRRGSCQG